MDQDFDKLLHNNIDKIIVVDNFYEQPYHVRSVALEQEFKYAKDHSRGASFPGKRTDFLHNIDAAIHEEFQLKFLNSLFDFGLDQIQGYVETNFQICTQNDGDSWIHNDDNSKFTHVGVIYLSPDPQENSGTLFFDVKKDKIDQFKNLLDENILDLKKVNRYEDAKSFTDFFVMTNKIDNVFNRAIFYHPAKWHKSDFYFGLNNLDSRLIQVIFAKIQLI